MRRHGGEPTQWLDLSTGINPWAWPWPASLPAVPARTWTDLPTADDLAALVAAAAAAYDVPAGVDIVAAPGTQALIGWLPRLARSGAVAIVGPTYGEHAATWAAAGHDVLACEEIPRLPAAARHVVVVTPNNPDGRAARAEALADVAHRVGRRGGWLVIDAAFADAGTAPAMPPGAIVLRSFGKFFGLAGLRLGFALAPPAIAAGLRDALGPWAVSGPALALGTAALRDAAWAADMRDRLGVAAAELDAVLADASCTPVGGTSLFRLVRHAAAAAVHEKLAAHHIWCRRFADRPDLLRFGLPGGAAALARLRAALV